MDSDTNNANNTNNISSSNSNPVDIEAQASTNNPFAEDEDDPLVESEGVEMENTRPSVSTATVNIVNTSSRFSQYLSMRPSELPRNSSSVPSTSMRGTVSASSSTAGNNDASTGISSDKVSSSTNSTLLAPKPMLKKGSVFISPAVLGEGDRSNSIYHRVRFSGPWLLVFIVLLVVQYVLLLVAGYDSLSVAGVALVLALVVLSALSSAASRLFVKKSYRAHSRNVELRGGTLTPEDEADDVDDLVSDSIYSAHSDTAHHTPLHCVYRRCTCCLQRACCWV
jgi:hypothetical protein